MLIKEGIILFLKGTTWEPAENYMGTGKKITIQNLPFLKVNISSNQGCSPLNIKNVSDIDANLLFGRILLFHDSDS